MLDSGIDIHIFTESKDLQTSVDEGLTASFFTNRVHVLGNLRSPTKVPLENYQKSIWFLFQPVRVMFLMRTVQKYEKVWRSSFRKITEYFPWGNMQFDIVHFNYPRIALRRFELGELFHAKTLVSFRGQDLIFYPGLFSPLFENADWLHFISRHLYVEAQHQGFLKPNYSIISPMVDINFYHPSQYPKPAKGKNDEWLFYTAARLYWIKGFEYLLEAIRILLDKGWRIHYYISGTGDQEHSVLYTIKDLHLEEHVHLLGWSKPEVKKQWMQKADLYVLGSVNEGFNNSVLQAQACGLPVVCSDAGGLPENIQDGVTGMIARRRDAKDFADKIEYLLSNPDLLIQMGKNARQRVVQHFSIDRVVTQFVEMYSHIYQL